MKIDSFDCAAFDRRYEAKRAALLIDTEGTISADTTSCVPIIAVEMKTERFPLWMHKHFNGDYSVGARGYFRWSDNGSACREILNVIQPYLELKHQQGEIVYALLNTMKGRGNYYTLREQLYRRKLVELLHELNNR